jgi:hypothetical protein
MREDGRMKEPTTDPGSRNVVTWWVITLLMAGLAVVLFAAAAVMLWDGQVKITYRSGASRIVTARDDALEFALRSLLGFGTSLMLGFIAWLRLDTWRTRHGASREAFEAQVTTAGSHTSKAGNVIAWILAIPFILIAVVVALGMILRALGKI